jgi:hypothetical protein
MVLWPYPIKKKYCLLKFASGCDSQFDTLPDTTGESSKWPQKILSWHDDDGYNWGGETRGLNPFSIIKFVKKNLLSIGSKAAALGP